MANDGQIHLKGPKVNPVYGFSLDKEKRDALLLKCPEKFGMNSATYMRLVVDAILEDRLVIKKPKTQEGVFQ